MRGTAEMSQSAWPHDMVIEVNEFPKPLMQLLYVHHVWGLDVGLHVPELDPLPEKGESVRPAEIPVDELASRWLTAWKNCWYWNWRPRADRDTALAAARPRELRGPSFWFRDHGTAGVDEEAFVRWVEQLSRLQRQQSKAAPERQVLDDLVPAWENGLQAIFVMPYSASGGAEWNGPHFMTIDPSTRLDPRQYGEALRVGAGLR